MFAPNRRAANLKLQIFDLQSLRRCGAIRLACRGDVMRALESSLNLKRSHAGLCEAGYHFMCSQILRRQQIRLIAQIAHFAIHDQFIRQRQACAHCPDWRCGRQWIRWLALAAVGDAQRAVHENFGGLAVAALILRISSSEFSRASTTRHTPSCRTNSMPRGSVSVICVLP